MKNAPPTVPCAELLVIAIDRIIELERALREMISMASGERYTTEPIHATTEADVREDIALIERARATLKGKA